MKNLEKLETPSFDTMSPVQQRKSKKGLIERIVSTGFQSAQHGTLSIHLPNGKRVVHSGSKAGSYAELKFNSWKAALSCVLGNDLNFAEAYMDGEISCPDLTALFSWYLTNENYLSKETVLSKPMKAINRFIHKVLNDNNKRGSRKNISYHYDLGNDFYTQWLDQSMSYSAADFSTTQDLYEAQQNKYKRISDSLELKDGERLLEIGCGWGGFAEHTSKEFSLNYKGITISAEQLTFAEKRLQEHSELNPLFHFEDYRDTQGQFDKIASIEMFEAVGEKHWPVYFNTIKERLAPQGKAAIQVITIEHERFLQYRENVDFIQKYIFPGGMLPSKEAFNEKADLAGLKVDNTYSFGPCYAETLRRWKHSFTKAWPKLEQQGFDGRFYRMWLYYLEYCEVGFDTGTIDVAQFTLTHK